MRKYGLSPLFAAIAIASLSTASYAETYVGIDYADIEAADVDLGGITLKGGYQLNEWASVEARIGFGVEDEQADIYVPEINQTVSAKAEINEYYGAYFVAGLPNESIFYPYVIAGYTKGEAEVSATASVNLGTSTAEYSASIKDDESDFSYGFGSRMNINDSFSANIEVMRYLDEDQTEFDAVSLGVLFKF